MLLAAGERDFEPIDTTIGFLTGSSEGDVVCTDVTIVSNLAFQKTRIFRVHVEVVEVGVTGITIHLAWAWVHIINSNCEC